MIYCYLCWTFAGGIRKMEINLRDRADGSVEAFDETMIVSNTSLQSADDTSFERQRIAESVNEQFELRYENLDKSICLDDLVAQFLVEMKEDEGSEASFYDE